MDPEKDTKALVSYEEFFRRAILRLKKYRSKGIHSEYSGCNACFREYYDNKDDPVDIIKRFHNEGKIFAKPVKRGFILYFPEDAPRNKTLEKMGLTADEEDKVSYEEFITIAFDTLVEEGYIGLHTVYSNFNEVFREYYDEDPVEITRELAHEGVIKIRPVKGGVMLYLLNKLRNKTDDYYRLMEGIIEGHVCQDCDGFGKVNNQNCQYCYGYGVLFDDFTHIDE